MTIKVKRLKTLNFEMMKRRKLKKKFWLVLRIQIIRLNIIKFVTLNVIHTNTHPPPT
jgi:hypothetical protein